MKLTLFRLMLVKMFVVSQIISVATSQEKPGQVQPAAPQPIVVANSPTTVDSASLVIEAVAKPQTVEFKEVSLSDVVEWIKEKTRLNVVLDQRSLNTIKILPSEPITDSLSDAPMYLLLDRLANQNIHWSASGGIITLYAADDGRAAYAMQYNVSDLLDAKFKGADLVDTIQSTIDPENWGNESASVVLLGDILFVRQTARNHRQVAGLLTALKTPSKRILIDEPKEHEALRGQLDQVVSIDVKDKPLIAVVAQLADSAKVDLRLSRPALSEAGTSERTPVSIQITSQKLSAILDILTTQYRLAWNIRDGAVWITTPESVTRHPILALYDVRDLCLNMDESDSLESAIIQQAVPESWETGEVHFPASGLMVVRQPEAIQSAVFSLLGDYRLALRNSKRRISPENDPEVIETKFYRMPTAVAEDLVKEIASLVAPGTWKSETQPDGVGKIRRLRSWDQQVVRPATKDASAVEATISYSVLVIEHRRMVHREIAETLQRIEKGDTPIVPGGMGGMGGFGGGLF